MTQLAKAAKRHRLALVGHEPELGELAAHVIGASRARPFKRAASAVLTTLSAPRRRAPVP